MSNLNHNYIRALDESAEYLNKPVGIIRQDSENESTRIITRQNNTQIILLVNIIEKFEIIEREIQEIHQTINSQNKKIDTLEKIAETITIENKDKRLILEKLKEKQPVEETVDITKVIEDQFKRLAVINKDKQIVKKKGFSKDYIQS